MCTCMHQCIENSQFASFEKQDLRKETEKKKHSVFSSHTQYPAFVLFFVRNLIHSLKAEVPEGGAIIFFHCVFVVIVNDSQNP